MSEFTAQNAREIVASESFTSRGYVIDQIRKAARNGQTSVGINDLNLKEQDLAQFEQDGFVVLDNNISWEQEETK